MSGWGFDESLEIQDPTKEETMQNINNGISEVTITYYYISCETKIWR